MVLITCHTTCEAIYLNIMRTLAFSTDIALFLFLTAPDVDECSWELHDCDTSAYCTNTNGSFECTCAMGYTGDGVTCAGLLRIDTHSSCAISKWLDI